MDVDQRGSEQRLPPHWTHFPSSFSAAAAAAEEAERPLPPRRCGGGVQIADVRGRGSGGGAPRSLSPSLSLPPRPSLTRSRRSVRRAPCAAEAAGCAATRRWTAKATDLSLVDAAASDDIEEGSSSFWKNHQIFTHFYSIN